MPIYLDIDQCITLSPLHNPYAEQARLNALDVCRLSAAEEMLGELRRGTPNTNRQGAGPNLSDLEDED